jgi:hypothetical protein
MLEDLKEKAETELSDLRKAEVAAAHSYEMLKQGLEDQVAADTKDMDAEKTAKAAALEEKAGAEGDLTVTVADLKGAEEKLEMVTADCKQVTADHETTVAGRAEELKVIAEASDVLKSTTSGAVGESYSLLQVVSKSQTSGSKVASLVKRLAKKHHSAALAQLASRIATVLRYGSTSGADPFAKVKGLITDMISKLEEEAGAEAAEKAYCDKEMSETESKKEELDMAISKLTSKIDKDAAKSAELKADVKELQSELAALAKQQADMDLMRKEEEAAYIQAKADLEQGLAGVRKALVVLRDYYAEKETEAALFQSSSGQPSKPELHAKGSGAATGIIGILEVVESDFATNLAKEETTESEKKDAYEKLTEENKITKVTKEQDVKYKTQEFTGLDKTIAEVSADRDTASTELSAVLEYY